jgi:hypothetical protein
MTDVLEVLIAARAEVKKGWCKNNLISPDGGVCALGAILVAEGCPRMYPVPRDWIGTGAGEAAHRLADAVGETGLIAPFNNAPETTKADVLAAFDRAIAAEAVKVSPDPSHVHAVVQA